MDRKKVSCSKCIHKPKNRTADSFFKCKELKINISFPDNHSCFHFKEKK